MLFKAIVIAVFATVMLPSGVLAQTVAQVGGPAELPPAGFKGQQFVDSRGCVFLRAGYGGQVNWVPRVTRERKAMCGVAPSFGPRRAIEIAEDAPAAAPAIARAPLETVASLAPAPRIAAAPVVPVIAATRTVAVAQQPAPYAENSPTGSYETVASNGIGAGQIGCYTSAPVPQRVRLRSGGTAVVCTRGDGTLTGWRPPIYPRGAGVGASLSDQTVARADHGQAVAGYGVAATDYAAAADAIPVPPKGYKLAWNDDRLNPNRGKGTAQGQAAQDQIWTRETPARLVSDKAAKKARRVAAATGGQLTVSTKSAATTPVRTEPSAGAGGAYVQVGTFGVASNAQGASARLSALGLPVAKARITSKGKPMQIVYAGPFGSVAEAQQALRAARQAGFSDAFIR